jgi:3-oxoadipate enol-lactonase / 4-carboxymuconolactone decarboxylase
VPFATIDNRRLFYRLEGSQGRPVLVLSHSIGADHAMWAPQVPDLLSRFQVLRYDIRGHGASDAPQGDYSIEELGREALGLVDALKMSEFAFCGLSLGGAIGQWLAIHAADRVSRLVLASASPQFGPRSNWDARKKAVLDGGMAAIVDLAMQRFFSPETLARGDAYAQSVRSVILGTDPIGYAGCCTALHDMDHTQLLGQVRAPTLVIVGDRDVATPWSGHGEILAGEIPNAQALHLPAAHLSNIERPRSFTAALLDFLQPQLGTQSEAESEAKSDPLQAGFEMRRVVLGAEHVDRSIAATTEFNREFQELITRYAWGTVWTRPGLSQRTRRLLVLSMTAALGRWEEFRLHLRAGLTHELEPCDLKEVLLQVAVYAGAPAANTGFHIAAEILGSAKNE